MSLQRDAPQRGMIPDRRYGMAESKSANRARESKAGFYQYSRLIRCEAEADGIVRMGEGLYVD